MTPTDLLGPGPDAITRYITETYPDTVVARAEGATFFSLDESHWPNFATIVTGEAFDDGSNLSRPGVFRLNIGALSRDTFQRLVGDLADPDFTELDRLAPPPGLREAALGCDPEPEPALLRGDRQAAPRRDPRACRGSAESFGLTTCRSIRIFIRI